MFSRLNDVCCNEISLVCVSNEHASIAVFIDKSWRAIGCIKDCFNSCILKDGLIFIGGASAYAATQHYSLLSLFRDENDEVKNKASKFLEKDTYSIMELPETASFLVKNSMTKETLGTVSFKINKSK